MKNELSCKTLRLSAFVVVLAASAAQAEFAGQTSSVVHPTTLGRADQLSSASVAIVPLSFDDHRLTSLALLETPVDYAVLPRTADDHSPVPEPRLSANAQVRELPPSPDSLHLFLSALLSFGAWQALRSARDFRLSNMPSWYHEGGPHQIGHIVACDLCLSDLPLCLFDFAPLDAGRRAAPLSSDTLHLHALTVRGVTALRGPPHAAQHLS